jgi:hypothetical protein
VGKKEGRKEGGKEGGREGESERERNTLIFLTFPIFNIPSDLTRFY